MPSVPSTDDVAILDHPLAEGEAHVGAKILDRVDFPFPLEKCNPNAISFYGKSETFRHEVSQARNPEPIVHVADDILRTLYFARPS